MDNVVELDEGHAVDQRVGYLYSKEEGLEVRVFLFLLDFLDFFFGIYTEYPFDDEHRQDDAYHTEWICSGIARGHEVSLLGIGGDLGHGLLCGSQAGRVCHGTTHHTYEGRYVLDVAEVVDAEHYGHVEQDSEHCKGIEPHATLLERREKARAYL